MSQGNILNRGLFFILVLCLTLPVFASEQPHKTSGDNPESEEKFDPATFIMGHIRDSHEWHLWTKSDGEPVSVPLPIILYSSDKGFRVFLSSHLEHEHEYEGFFIPEEGPDAGKILERTESGEILKPWDFSITRTVVGILFGAVLLALIFVRMGKYYNRKKVVVPKGMNGFIEPMIIFIRDEVALPNIGEEKYERHMPYLLTVFFFILISNILGLVPGIIPFGANVTGNIAVTMVLAVFTFVITQFSGTKTYWKHLVAQPGVPWWLSPIMVPVEFIGLFTKPFALMVRLFANISAGHIIVLGLVSLIFIFKSMAVAPASVAFVVFMDCIELLVAVLQAYVFTLLSALFIGLATREHHH
jgi:F-type H+-transporting ATPase subunit a